MRALIIVGSDMSVNSSANLCHKSYISGLIDNNATVDIITSGNISVLNKEIKEANISSYPMESLYEKIGSIVKKGNLTTNQADNNSSSSTVITQNTNTGLLNKVKKTIHYLYGPYEVYSAWKNKAIKYRNNCEYDIVISLSFPPISHLLAYELIQKKHIKTKKWIQLWEDPWCLDLVFRSLNNEKRIHRAEKEEARLLSLADEILYVSPITLENQKAAYPDSANKMRWLPVPSYYSVTTPNKIDGKVFGYFGDYSSQIRNLKPFYEAAIETGVTVNICGSSDEMFSSTNSITVRPRISLDELRPIEDNTNVLVFLSNLHGGQIPGKIYQYAATDKIVLFILDGTEDEINILKDFFGKYNRFVFCNNNKDSISKAISDICNGKYDKYNTPLDIFTPEKIVHKILNNESM